MKHEFKKYVEVETNVFLSLLLEERIINGVRDRGGGAPVWATPLPDFKSQLN